MMVAGAHQPTSPEAVYAHPLDALVNDPSGRAPLCDEARFAEILEGMVADNAPQLFAVVQEYGARVDARIVGWGMAFEDDSAIVDVDGNVHLGVPNIEDRLRGFGFGSHIRPRLVWFNADAATPPDDET
ncbi:MAG: hypothetical protein ACRDQ5_08115 [Sciscionella sp.]